MEYKEGDVMLCIVDKIEGTTVFVHLPNGERGTLVTSEIAPGRIRNLREYVVPKKKIVCKILRKAGDHFDMSLRRVTTKEKSEILEKVKQEQIAKSALHSILKEEAEKVEKKILEKYKSLSEFMINCKEDSTILKKFIPKEFLEKIEKVINKRKKGVEIKSLVKLKCAEDDGIKRIKEILKINDEKISVTYISAGNFQIKIKEEDYKKANHLMEKTLEEIEEKSKKLSCEYSYEEIKQK